MTISTDFLFYDHGTNGVTVRSYEDFLTFALDTGIVGGIGAIVEDHTLHLAQSLFTHNTRIAATNLTPQQTQMPLKIRGTVAEITQHFNRNYVYAPVIHPLVVGIVNIALVDEVKSLLEVRGVIINTNAIQFAHETEPLAPALVIETEEQNQEALVKLLDVMDDDPDNIALLIPIRDAISEFEEKTYTPDMVTAAEKPTEDGAIGEVKPEVQRKNRKKKD